MSIRGFVDQASYGLAPGSLRYLSYLASVLLFIAFHWLIHLFIALLNSFEITFSGGFRRIKFFVKPRGERCGGFGG